MKLNICCFSWNGDRGWTNKGLNAKYVNALYNGVECNYSGEFDFFVFVDEQNKKVCDKTTKEGVNVVKFDSPSWKGCLPKYFVYSEDTPFTGDRVIVMDLDTVVTGNLDEMFSYDGPFATREAFRRKGASGGDMLGFPVHHDLGWIWDYFVNNTEEVERKSKKHRNAEGDERWVYDHFVSHIDFWQRMYPNQYLSYKNHLKNVKCLPEDCGLVSMHGRPRPHQLDDNHWLKQYWSVK